MPCFQNVNTKYYSFGEAYFKDMMIEMEKLDEENLGQVIYFFEKACAISGSILEVNPFNQPGVEEYKKNMFRLLEKPGY